MSKEIGDGIAIMNIEHPSNGKISTRVKFKHKRFDRRFDDIECNECERKISGRMIRTGKCDEDWAEENYKVYWHKKCPPEIVSRMRKERVK